MRHSFGKYCLMTMPSSSGLSALCGCVGASRRWAPTGPCEAGGIPAPGRSGRPRGARLALSSAAVGAAVAGKPPFHSCGVERVGQYPGACIWDEALSRRAPCRAVSANGIRCSNLFHCCVLCHLGSEMVTPSRPHTVYSVSFPPGPPTQGVGKRLRLSRSAADVLSVGGGVIRCSGGAAGGFPLGVPA